MMVLVICTVMGTCIDITREAPGVTCFWSGQIEVAKILVNQHPGYQVKSYKCRA